MKTDSNSISKEEAKKLQSFIKDTCGFKPSIKQLPLYRTIWVSCLDNDTINNERLACLGNSVMKEVITHYLFQKFLRASAFQISEFYLKLTQRTYLSRIVQRLKLDQHPLEGETALLLRDFIYTDMLKAFIGALLIDKGHSFTENFIHKKMLQLDSNLNNILQESINYKGKLMAWAQKNKSTVVYKPTKELKYGNKKIYVVSLYINNEWIANGCDAVVKCAEQIASLSACEILEL